MRRSRRREVRAPPTPLEAANPTTQIGRVFPQKIYRFRRSERMLHWSLALPFLSCLASAAVLFLVYNQHPLLGGRVAFSWAHRVAGACLIALPALALLLNRKDYRTHLSNMKEGWAWTRDEVRWLFLMPLSLVKKGVTLPEEGKFNAAEKLNFMSSMGTTAVMAISGLIVWVSPSALGAWFVHLAMAAMVLPLIGGHIFMATLNGDTRVGLSGMFTGWVSRGWASHHYRRWYKQIISRHLQEHGSVPELDTTEHRPAAVPSTPARRYALTKVRWLAAGASMGLAAASAVGAVAWGLSSRMAHLAPVAATESAVLYVVAPQPLLSKPELGAAPQAGAPLAAGAKVTRLKLTGDFALVEDPLARLGYLPALALSGVAPVAVASVEFADCAPATGEATSKACEARAGGLRDACLRKCPPSRKAVCSEICGDRFSTCVEGCTAPLATRDALPKSAK